MSQRYVHGHHESVVDAHAARTVDNSAEHLEPHLRPGMAILDVGCGPGSITIDLARRVGPSGSVLGIDASADVISRAREAAARSGITNVRFEVGDAYDPAASDAFDVVHAHQILHHLDDPVRALAAWRRVARELVSAREVVYSATTVHPETPPIARWRSAMVELMAANGGDADAGAKLKAWSRAAGFSEIETGAATWCFETDAARAWWGGQWRERALRSSFADETQARGVLDEAEREQISSAWETWTHDPDGWFAMLHAWVLARP